jgi:6-phosphogluconolactonase
MGMRHVKVFPGKDALIVGTAEWILSACGEAIAGRGACSIALSGGSTPRALYHLLASDPWRKRFEWSRIELFQVDERVVPIDHPDSNFGMIERELLRSVQIPEKNVHRMHAELGAQAAAEEYESQLRKSFVAGGVPQFDVLLLGIGEDGHTASLFPGTEALHESSRLVLGYTVEKLNAPRITLTFPVINHARKVLFLVSGENKAEILREVLQGDSPELRYPAAMVDPESGLLYWHLDSDAASMIPVAVSE